MADTFTCACCGKAKPSGFMFYVLSAEWCIWCAEDNGLATPRYMKGL